MMSLLRGGGGAIITEGGCVLCTFLEAFKASKLKYIIIIIVVVVSAAWVSTCPQLSAEKIHVKH